MLARSDTKHQDVRELVQFLPHAQCTGFCVNGRCLGAVAEVEQQWMWPQQSGLDAVALAGDFARAGGSKLATSSKSKPNHVTSLGDLPTALAARPTTCRECGNH
ncbi:unnamed protein product [Symbiodinium natans]|uniref:Uncharacterized protein n=1 Tax=Symbiodinium natans TaxID=878477 RepID=A0A812H3W3_9DINO|nr:unnamed protein product [Symbiodinium natans]